MANELAVGANSREEEVESLEDEEPVLEAFTAATGPARAFFDPMLLMFPDDDVLVENLVPIDDTFVELVWDIPVPISELLRAPERELFLLIRVPAAPLMTLLLVEGATPNEGIGDLEREDDIVPFAESCSLLTRSEGTRVALAVAMVGRAGAMEAFCTRTLGAAIFSFVASTFAGCTGLGMLEAVVGGALPRFHTLCTIDLAEEKKPNLEGFGLAAYKKKHQEDQNKKQIALT